MCLPMNMPDATPGLRSAGFGPRRSDHGEQTIIPAIAQHLPPRARDSIVAQFIALCHVQPYH